MLNSENSAGSLDVRATLNYAGAMQGRPRLDTQNPPNSNLALEPHEVLIQDARSATKPLQLEEQGFEFTRHASQTARDPQLFAASNFPEPLPTGLRARYAAELQEFVKIRTNAAVVMPQINSFLVRASSRARQKSWAGTAGLVHLDYTETSARQLRDWTLEAHGIPLPPHRHFAFIQTWRAVSPGPQDNSLCVCDGSSVPYSDAVHIDAVMGPADVPAMCFEFRVCRKGAGHSWYYLSDMDPDDVLLFKGFDSRFPRAMNAMHSAFDNPLAGPEAAPRHSIEARFLAFYD
jgi:hypothetical protein